MARLISFHLALVLGLFASVVRAEDPKTPCEGPDCAAKMCALYGQLISKAVPPPEKKLALLNSAKTTFGVLSRLVRAQEEVAKTAAKQAGPDAKLKETPALVQVADGTLVGFHAGGPYENTGNPTPDMFYRMKNRLQAIEDFVTQRIREKTDGALDEGATVATIEVTDPKLIKEALETAKRIGYLENPEVLKKQKEVAMKCVFQVAGAGAATGLGHGLLKNRTGALEKDIVEDAKETTVYTPEQHEKLARHFIKLGGGDEQAVEKHMALLKEMEKVGVHPQYGSRNYAYQQALAGKNRGGKNRSGYDIDEKQDDLINEKLNDLARGPRRVLSVEALARDFESFQSARSVGELPEEGGKHDDPYLFTPDELNRRYEGNTGWGAYFVSSVGEGLGLGGIGGAVGFLACTKAGGQMIAYAKAYAKNEYVRRRFGEPPPPVEPPPPQRIEKLIARLDAATNPLSEHKPGGKREFLWLGSTIGEKGSSVDLVLEIDTTLSQPSFKLTGLEITMPPEWNKPLPPPPPEPVVVAKVEEPLPPPPPPPKVVKPIPPPPKPYVAQVNMVTLKSELIAQLMPTSLRAEQGPINEIMAWAMRLKLTQAEMDKFQTEIRSARPEAGLEVNLQKLRDFLNDVEDER